MLALRVEREENNMEFGASVVVSDEGDPRLDDRSDKRTPWRPVHYLGSKLRALPVLEEAISSVAPAGATVCDLFAGSGTVAARLAKFHPVTAVDIQEYSRVICDALLRPSRLSLATVRSELSAKLEAARDCGPLFAAAPLVELEAQVLAEARDGDLVGLATLLESGSMVTSRPSPQAGDLGRAIANCRSRLAGLPTGPISSMALRHFGGVYFSYQQAAELDVILQYAHEAPNSDRSTLIAAALSTASEIVNTVGKHFAQPLRPRNKDGSIKRTLYAQASRDRYKDTFEIFIEQLSMYVLRGCASYSHQAIRSDFNEFINSQSFDAHVVYADPPYTRDHYSRFYHVLETLALRDDPEISTNTAHGKTEASRGVYRQDRHQSPFCIRSEAPGAFNGLFQRVSQRGVPLVLSYSPYASEKNAHPRVMTMRDVTELAKRHFKYVDVSSVGAFSHSRLNRSDLNKDISYEAEYLLTCQP